MKALSLTIVLLATTILLWWIFVYPENRQVATYVGSDACAGCHQQQHETWKTSDHHLAMGHASEETVLGNFDNASMDYFGRKTRFTREQDRFLVTTENERGETQAFTIKYTLGHKPLQQYLVEFDDGRVQTLPFSWDTRPAAQGGQRWFHIYPEENITPENPLFWTRPQQNWNYMCADCHTTNFSKNFNDEKNTFHSQWSETGNGCESCHGPGSAHVELMQKNKPAAKDADLLIKKLHAQTEQIDNCGACHARRARLKEDPANETMHQTWRPELLHGGLYFDDGRMRDEVFNIGSFMQSKMYAAGVTCTQCHEPHGGKIKIEGNGLCTQCHAPETYENTKHHNANKNAQCVSCHMPTQTYMVIDKRHDHFFSIPKPDKENAFWLARHEQQNAENSLLALIRDSQQRGIVRATALIELGPYLSAQNLQVALDQLASADPLLRLAAVQALSVLPPAQRAEQLTRLLDDSSRAVRLELAPALADLEDSLFDAKTLKQRNAVFDEYVTWLKQDADRASALVNLASFYMARGNRVEAQHWFEKALQRDETSLPALLNFADFHRSENNETRAAGLLQQALALYPDSADAHYAWGLLQVRRKDYVQALASLKKAYGLAPGNSRFAYVYGVGLYSAGKTGEGLDVLATARQQFPANREITSALLSYCAEQQYNARSTHRACQGLPHE